MAYGITSGGGAGIHPGAPVIWPEGKSESQAVEQSQNIAQPGQVKPTQAPQAAPTAEQQEAMQSAQQAMQQQMATISRRMTMQDLSQQLMQLNIRPSEANKQMALQMLQHGLELSPDNFAKLARLMQGDNSQNLQSAMLSLLKGLDGNPESVGLLNKFLGGNSQVSDQNQTIQQALQNFTGALATGKGLLPPALAGQLAGLAGNWDKLFRKMPGKDEASEGMLQKKETFDDIQAFRGLLKGTLGQLQKNADPNSQEVQKLQRHLSDLEEQLKDLAEHWVSQSILSKSNARPDPAMPEKFFYWQIPNFMTTPPKDLELLIQKDAKNPKEAIDPANTKIIMKLQTESLGPLVFEIKVKDRDLDYRINTEDDETKALVVRNFKDLHERMTTQDFKIKGIQVVKRRVDLQKFLVPVLDLDGLTRVRTQV